MSNVLDMVTDARRMGENLFETAERLLLAEALIRSNGVQAEAGRLLGSSKRVTQYKMKNYSMRPMDVERRGCATVC